MKISADQVGRFCWITYLILVFPVCVICIWLGILLIRGFFVPDVGVIETAPVSSFQSAIVGLSVLALPVLWIIGVIFGHRFNGLWRPVVPFALHLVPVATLSLIFLPDPQREGDSGPAGVFVYLLLNSLLLVAGLLCVVLAALKSRKEESEG
ncbi:hypothetical protein N9Y81_01390 [Akkermansiaceae bacterium]|jgi:hypothetical protein|nr:hypothetical protein [Akkermansiaceae bacterium]